MVRRYQQESVLNEMTDEALIESALNLRCGRPASSGESVVVFGASFNPVTQGHLALLHALLEEPSLIGQPIYVILAGCSPLKSPDEYAPAIDRLQMLRALIAQHIPLEQQARLRIETTEIERDAPSRMSVTLALLTLKHAGKQRYTLVCGYDHLACFTQWYQWTAYQALATLMFYPRNGLSLTSEACLQTLVQLLKKGIRVRIVCQDAQQQAHCMRYCFEQSLGEMLHNLHWIERSNLHIPATRASDIRAYYHQHGHSALIKKPPGLTSEVHQYILAHRHYGCHFNEDDADKKQ